MSFEIYLRLDKVKGEVSHPKKLEWIHITSWNWGGSQTGTTHVGTGGGGGKASYSDLVLSKYMDKSSATLLQFMSKGTHIASGELAMLKAGGGEDEATPYLNIKLKDIIVTGVSFGGADAEERFTESVVLNFRRFLFEYAIQDTAGGKGVSIPYAHDIAANKTMTPQQFESGAK